MSNMYYGNQPIIRMYKGGTEIFREYHGSTLRWEKPSSLIPASIRSYTNKSSISGSVSPIAKPAGTQAGDLLLLVTFVDWGTAAQLNPGVGFTELHENDLSDNNIKVNVSYKIAGSSEPSSYTSGDHTGTDTVETLFCIQNAATSGAYPIASLKVAATNSKTSVTAPSITPSTGNGLLISAAGVEYSQSVRGDYAWTPPTGMTETLDQNSDRWISATAAWQSYTSPNATGTRVFGLSASPSRVDTMALNVFIPSAGS